MVIKIVWEHKGNPFVMGMANNEWVIDERVYLKAY